MQLHRLSVVLVILCLASSGMTGCSGPVAGWITGQRNHQGDLALARGNLREAALAYRLALQASPENHHARAGVSAVALEIANRNFQGGHFDDALAALLTSAKYDPQSVRLQALRSEIEQAKIKREIVLSNYPAYKESAAQLLHAYAALRLMNYGIEKHLRRFGYTYDTKELAKAIRESYELDTEIGKTTARLVSFRQLAESGVPEADKTQSASPGSLLPLP